MNNFLGPNPMDPPVIRLMPHYTVEVKGATSEGRSYTLTASGDNPEELGAGIKSLEATFAQDPLIVTIAPQYRTGGR